VSSTLILKFLPPLPPLPPSPIKYRIEKGWPLEYWCSKRDTAVFGIPGTTMTIASALRFRLARYDRVFRTYVRACETPEDEQKLIDREATRQRR